MSPEFEYEVKNHHLRTVLYVYCTIFITHITRVSSSTKWQLKSRFYCLHRREKLLGIFPKQLFHLRMVVRIPQPSGELNCMSSFLRALMFRLSNDIYRCYKYYFGRKVMAEKYPKLSALVLDEDSLTLALNEEYVQTGEVIDLKNGDTIALIPPISGG